MLELLPSYTPAKINVASLEFNHDSVIPLAAKIKALGYNVTNFNSSKELIDALSESEFNIVVIDVDDPRGLMCLRSTQEKAVAVDIIAATNKLTNVLVQKLVEIRIDHIVSKRSPKDFMLKGALKQLAKKHFVEKVNRNLHSIQGKSTILTLYNQWKRTIQKSKNLSQVISQTCHIITAAIGYSQICYFHYNEAEQSLMAIQREPKLLFGKAQPKFLLPNALSGKSAINTWFKNIASNPDFNEFIERARKLNPKDLRYPELNNYFLPVFVGNDIKGVFLLTTRNELNSIQLEAIKLIHSSLEVIYQNILLKQRLDEAEWMDAATKIPNFRFFNYELKQKTKQCYQARKPLSLVIMHFWELENNPIHADWMERWIYSTKNYPSFSGKFYRLAQDSFALIVPNKSVDKLLKSLQAYHKVTCNQLPSNKLKFGMSLAEMPTFASNADDLLAIAKEVSAVKKAAARNFIAMAKGAPSYIAPYKLKQRAPATNTMKVPTKKETELRES